MLPDDWSEAAGQEVARKGSAAAVEGRLHFSDDGSLGVCSWRVAALRPVPEYVEYVNYAIHSSARAVAYTVPGRKPRSHALPAASAPLLHP